MTNLQALLQTINQLSLDELLYIKEYVLDREKFLLQHPASNFNLDEDFATLRRTYGENQWDEEEDNE